LPCGLGTGLVNSGPSDRASGRACAGAREAAVDVRRELRRKVLACWCGPDKTCHAGVLLDYGNADDPNPAPCASILGGSGKYVARYCGTNRGG
jgi:Domain of unknown function (DUF4326)